MKAWWRRRRRDEELDEEIASHLAMAAAERVARGESPEEARLAARREFGNVTQVKEVTRAMWGGAWLESAVREVRLAARSLRRSPGFLVIAVLALGLGLGLSTTMFAVLDAVLHPARAYANADRLYQVSPMMSLRAGASLTNAELAQLIRQRVPSLDAVVSFGLARDPIRLGDQELEQFEFIVPPAWFETVGVRPRLGRAFTASDGDGVAVVSHEVWRGLGGPRNLAGVRVTIGERSYAVIGVLPRITRSAGAYLPLRAGAEASTPLMSMPLVRLAPGADAAQAKRDLELLAAFLTGTYASPRSPWALNLYPWLDTRQPSEELHDLHFAMVGSALAVLLIACVNLAHLMLARGLAKRRELAVRMALGAGRSAAVRVMLAESAVIALGGVALGAVVALWGSMVLESLIPYELSWLGFIQTQLSWRVFALGALAALVSVVLFGLLPALRVAFSVQLTEPLKDESGTTTAGARRRYSPLVIIEVALALILLMGGTLLLRTVHRLRNAPTGFDPETLVTGSVMGVRSFNARPGGGRDTIAVIDWGQVLATARAVPGVLGAALEARQTAMPSGAAFTAEMAGDSTRTITMQQYRVVSPNYLQVHGLPILQGRDFEPGDAVGDGVAILSSVAAARLYPKGDAVGHMVKLGAPAARAPWVRIVGVARTPLTPWLDASAPGPLGNAPVWIVRPPGRWSSATVLARTAGRDPEAMVRLRHALRSVPGAREVSVQPYTWARDAEVSARDFLAKVFVALGAVGLGLAALGLYGVLSYVVARRMREFGVRIALGAEPRVLFRMVMHDGLVMLLAGTGVGAFGALAAAYLFNAVLIGVYPTDVLSLVIAEALLLTVGLAATLAPARRAVRASPLEILRAV